MARTKTHNPEATETATSTELELVEVELGGKLVKIHPAAAAEIAKLQSHAEPEAADDDELTLVDGKVLVDYRGVIARPKGQDEVAHTSSPVTQQWPEAGRLEFVAQPGLNRYDPAHWVFYRDTSPQVRELVKNFELTALPRIPQSEQDLRDLIARSCDDASLVWLRDVISERREELYDRVRLEDRSKLLLDQIDKRLGSTNKLKYEAQPHRIPAVNYGKAIERGIGMGGGT